VSPGSGSSTNAAARCSGPRFSPLGRWTQVPPTATQAQLRLAFGRWGRPQRLRVDNGAPWGTRGDLPTDLELWLLGAEVGVVPNPPGRPQDNGVVERSQGTGKRWGEPWTCDSTEELQRRLGEMDEIQRREYPSIAGQSRWEAFPELAHSGRGYTPEWEEAHWSLARVAAALAGYAVRRRVDSCGTISLYNRRHYIGTIHKKKDVFVMFDPETYEWVVADHEGRQLSRQPATHINREDIMNLTVSLRDKRTSE
jgi:hypothetical protein